MKKITIPLISFPQPLFRRIWRYFTPMTRVAIAFLIGLLIGEIVF